MKTLRHLALMGLFLSLLFSAAGAKAELVSLQTGEPVVGKITEARSDGIIMETYSGSRLWIGWDRMFEGDAARLKREWGLVVDPREDAILIPGTRLVMKDGLELTGIVVREDQQLLVLKTQTGSNRIPHDRIERREDSTVNALLVFSPGEIVDQRRKETQASTPAELFGLAIFAQKVGAFRHAKALLSEVVAGDPDFQPTAIQSQLEALELLIADQSLLETAERILSHHRSGQIDRAIEALTQLVAEQPDSPLIADLKRRGVSIDKLNAYQQGLQVKRVSKAWFLELQDAITAVARDRELTLQEAQQMVARSVEETVIQAIAAKLGIEGTEVAELFQERAKVSKYVGDYGSGTYLVVKLPKRKRSRNTPSRQQGGRRGGRNGQGQRSTRQRRTPKRPAEEWWAQMDLPAKRRYLTAYYAEKSKSVELVREERPKCSRCGGRGFRIVFSPGSGSNTQVVCDRCYGIKYDKRVIFR